MRFSRSGRRPRTFGFEVLECRRPMAGNVTASVQNGSLVLIGSVDPNAIEVSGTQNQGEVRITPLGGTTVNGNGNPVNLQGVTGGLNVSLKAGNDELYVKGFAFPGDGVILGDEGADTIRLGAWVAYGQTGTGDVSFGGYLWITEQNDNSVADNDYIFLGRVVVDEFLSINGAYGNDTFEFYNVTVLGQNVVGAAEALTVNGKDGNDVYNVAYTTVHGNADFSTDGLYGGNDLVSMITSVIHGKMYINVWHGANTVALNANQFLKTLEVYSEIGNDAIILTNSYCVGKVTMTSFYSLSNSNDYFRIEGNTISERIYINAGSGNDAVILQYNQIATAKILCEAGYDSLTVNTNYFYPGGFNEFSGGSDWDALVFAGNTPPNQVWYSITEFP